MATSTPTEVGDSREQERRVVQGLVPFAADFIAHDWDWSRWSTEPPDVPLVDGGPRVCPPGWFKTEHWTIAFEGAYPWAVDFSYIGMEAGPAQRYLDEFGLHLECYAGYAIEVHFLRAD